MPVGVTPVATWRLSALSILPDCRLAVTFHDGTTGVVDLSAVTSGSALGIYEPLKDPRYFAQARLELGTVTWPNGGRPRSCFDARPDPPVENVVRP
jgi:hypothetical protein